MKKISSESLGAVHIHTHTGIFNKEKLRSEKGSITVFVLATMLFMLVITTVFYTSVKTKTVAQAKDINKIQEEYSKEENLEDEMEEKYEDIKDTVDTGVIIRLYKLTGEEYQVSEWTNQDIKMRLDYYGGTEPEDKYFYIDGEKVDYVEDYLIKDNCTITAEYMGKKSEVVVSRIDKENPTIKLGSDGGTYLIPTEGEKAKIETTIEANDTKSGVKTIEYAWGESNVQEPNTYSKLENGDEVQKIDCQEGTYYLWTKVTDIAGNEAKYTSKEFTVLSKEESQNQIILTANPSTEIWTNQDVTVTAKYSAGLVNNRTLECTGTKNIDYVINGTTSVVVKNNNKVVTAYAEDKAGNRVTKTLEINKIDKTLPTVKFSPNGGDKYTMPTAGKATIKTTLNVADEGGSGLNITQYVWSTNGTVEPESGWTDFKDGDIASKTDCELGNYYLWVKVTDIAGNRATTKVSNVFTVKSNTDIENKITLIPNTEEWTNEDVIVTVNYGANLTQNRKAGFGSASTENATTVTVKENGVVYAEATDIVGNKVIANLKIGNIDKVKPTVSLSPNGGTNYTMPTSGNATIKTTVTAADTGGSQLNTLQYAWSTSNTTVPSIWTTFTNEEEVSKKDCTAGNYYLWTKVTDNAGNTTTNTSNAFTVGANTLEENKITLKPDTEGWTNKNVIVTVSYGANLTQNRKAGFGNASTANATTVTVEANGTVYAEATDVAGNKVTANLLISNIDKTLPTVSVNYNGYTQGNWTQEDVTISLTAQDELSGIDKIQYSNDNKDWQDVTITKTNSDKNASGSIAYTTDTNKTIYYRALDKAGNVSAVFGPNTVKVDKTAPTIDSITNSSNGNWSNGTVKITLTGSDSGSGIKEFQWYENGVWTTKELTTTGNTGTITYTAEKNETIKYRVIDNVGNISEEATTVINLDKTAPVISPITNSSNQNWTNKDIQLSWSITEDGSGIAKVEHSSDGKTWAGELQSYEWYGLTRNNQRNDTIYIRATDKAGNVSNVQSTNMKIDKTKPTITLSPDGQTTSNKTLSSKITAKDTGGSNLKTLQYAWSTSNTQEPSSYQTFTNEQPVSKSNASVGKHYLWVKVSDNAGNQTSKVSKAFNVTGLTGGTTKYVKKGGRITLTPTKQGDAGEITWTTSDSNGASLSTTKGNSVTVTGKTAGTYTVTAKESAGGATTSYKIEVTQLTSGGNLTVLEGNTAQLKAPTKSSNAGTITYSVTSGSNYASVNSSTGQVTGKEALAEKTTATITAEESNGGATCTYTVTIKVWNGNGLLSDPYKISNPRDFKKLAEKVNKATSTSSTTTGTAYRYTSKYFKQTANIALGGSSSNLYTQIGKSSTAYFNGTYDGNSKTISGIYLSTSSSIAGTFNRLGSNGTIKNLGIISSTVRSTSTTEAGSLGAICGINLGTIQNCYNKGVAVTGPSGVGGICGRNRGIIKNSHNTGTITGSKHNVGGIAGWNQKQITDSYNTGAIKFSGSGTWYAYGGIVGWNDGSVNATATQVYRCYNTGTINGCQYVGGVAGTNEHSARVFYSYNRNSVSGTRFVGGLVGVNNQEGYIRNCYNRSVVKGGTHIGGLVGANQYGAMTYNSYNTGKVTGTTNIGGVVGYNRDSGSVTSRCYYLNGTAPAGGANDGTAILSVTVKTSAQMQEAAFVTLLDTGNSQKFWKADTTSTVKYPILSWQ